MPDADTSRSSPDWLDSFLEYSSPAPSPVLFRRWAGIATLAGAMERRLHVRTSGRPVFPNLYTLLVGPPTCGKSVAIDFTKDFWVRMADIKLAPDNASRESLLDNLEAARRIVQTTSTSILEFHSLAIAASEYGVLCPAHDLAFMSTLTHIWDNPVSHKETRRTSKKELLIANPQFNIVAGTQPGFLSEQMPEVAWSQGFASRLILIYSGEAAPVEFFEFEEYNQKHRDNLLADLNHIVKLFGKMEFTNEAKAAITVWNKNGQEPKPTHSKLQYYNGRRGVTMLKLCMISSISRSDSLLIDVGDFHRALEWMAEAEEKMPDVFRAMIHRSDNEVMLELHMYLFQLFNKDREQIHVSRAVEFLRQRVPVEKIERILDAMYASRMVVNEAGLLTPIARTKTVIE